MNQISSKIITRTALLLALTIVAQFFGRYVPLGPGGNFFVGPLVNACLVITVFVAGLGSAAVISFVAPLTAFLTGQSAAILFLPFIGIGNFLLVLGCYLLKKNKIAGILLGSFMKFVFLFVAIKTMLPVLKLPSVLMSAMLFLFSWPQLVTALIGGALALTVLKLSKLSETNIME